MGFYAVKCIGSIFMPILGDRENLRIVRIVLSLYDSEMYTVRCVYDSEEEMKVKRFMKHIRRNYGNKIYKAPTA